MPKDVPTETTEELVQEIQSLKLTGPGAAARLCQEGIGMTEAEKILRETLGFYVLADPKKQTLSVSLGIEYPLVGAHPKTETVSWNTPTEHHWLSETE